MRKRLFLTSRKKLVCVCFSLDLATLATAVVSGLRPTDGWETDLIT